MSQPTITGVEWIAASTVLKNEAAHFTPWLSKNLGLLGDALGLQDLELVATEHDVLDKRLDILAQCVDLDGSSVPVVIENQYGRTDHSHLGQLITYLAQQQKGYAVWITEHVHDAHLSAINFLNRVTLTDVGFFLVRARFTHGQAASYQVHFDVAARPNDFEKPNYGHVMTKKLHPRYQYAAALRELVDTPLRDAGWASTGVHVNGFVWVRWPSDLWFAAVGYRTAFIRPHEQSCQVRVRVSQAGTKEENDAVLAHFRAEFGPEIESLLDPDDILDWEAA